MQLKTLIKHVLLIVIVTVSTLLVVFLAIFPSIFTGANDFTYTRTPAGSTVTSPVSIRIQGVFHVDFCQSGGVTYQIIVGDHNQVILGATHEPNDVVDDTLNFVLIPGYYTQVLLICSNLNGNMLSRTDLSDSFTVVEGGAINIVKTVVNDNGGTKVVSDFPLFVGASSVVSGVTNTFAAPASYIVTETGDSNYTQTFSGDCDVNGNINLALGDSKFCIVTNDDIAPSIVTTTSSGGDNGGSVDSFPPPVPPLIDVVKVPNPLALPNGPGLVTYTYTLRNIGTVTAHNITMVGDTCSPIVLVSGDTNSDANLDVNETWIYTCTTALTETHTNTVVATGWANGISAVDIASSTVVVGVPIVPDLPDAGIVVPPLIHVTKVPNKLTLLAGGGTVTYTSMVTNPGEVSLSNVRLVDDKCGPVKYISGDNNNNSKLDTTEAWKYTCQTNLIKTTVNTVVATGEAYSLTARDFAIATVVVALAIPSAPVTTTEMATPTPSPMVVISDVPTLPDTGWASEENVQILYIIMSILFAILLMLYVVLSEYFDEKRL